MRSVTPTVLVLAALGIAVPAFGGSSPLLPSPASAQRAEEGAAGRAYTHFRTEEHERVYLAAPQVGAGKAAPADGFTFVGGESLAQLTPHKLVWAGGGFTHSDECDHAIRQTRAPTPAEVEANRLQSPGA